MYADIFIAYAFGIDLLNRALMIKDNIILFQNFELYCKNGND